MSNLLQTQNIFAVEEQKLVTAGLLLIFLALTSVIIGFVFRNSGVVESGFSTFLFYLVIGVAFFTILALYTNYRVLLWLTDNSYEVFLALFALLFGVSIIWLGLVGLALVVVANSFGYVLFVVGGLIVISVYRNKSKIMTKIEMMSEWFSIAASIVIKEPGMIILATIQFLISAILFLTFITLTISVSVLTISLSTYFAVVIIYFWLSLTLIYYFDAANTYVAYARLNGVDPKISHGLNVANKKLGSILIFALISAIVMTIVYTLRSIACLRHIRDDNPIVLFFAYTIGMIAYLLSLIAEGIYHLISFFVIPSIVIKGKKTFGAMSESASLFRRKTWDVLFTDTAFSLGAILFYFVTGLITGFLGFLFGLTISPSLDPHNMILYSSVVSTFGQGQTISVGLYTALIAIIFGTLVTKFFIRPLYVSLVTIVYVYATEGKSAIKGLSHKTLTKIDDTLK